MPCRSRSRAAAALLAVASVLRSAHGACPASGKAPYMDEPSPFGWPLAPNDWDFSHPECWESKYMICGGARQSPMDLSFDRESAAWERASSRRRSRPNPCVTDVAGGDGALLGKSEYADEAGHHPVVKVSKYMRTFMVNGTFGSLALMDSASGKEVEYQAVQVHLTYGSLHTVGGRPYAAEMLVVHKPRHAADALEKGVIVSVLFEESNTSSPVFSGMGFDEQKVRPSWPVGPFSIESTMRPALQGKSYSYNGSVPVPPCSETIKWFILADAQPISARHLTNLRSMLERHAGGWQKRPPVPRHPSGGTCRTIAENSVSVGGGHEGATCAAARSHGKSALSARCWTDSCGRPANIDTTSAAAADGTLPKAGIADIVHYKATSHVSVVPSMYTLDAVVKDHSQLSGHGNFGYLLLNGRVFLARKISIKAISQHTIDGKRYAGELMIEHVLFGDHFPAGAASEGKGHSDHSAGGSGGGGHEDGGHRRLTAEDSNTQSILRVMVSVPLKLGKESVLLRELGLGRAHLGEAIRDGHAYDVHGAPLDLMEGLQSALAGEWFWYKGSLARPGADCNDWGVRWMVFETPVEVSLSQLNRLALPVSGVDSSLLPAQGAAAADVFRGALPRSAVDAGHGERCSGKWSYEDTRCWELNYTSCAGTKQSPIDIKTAGVSKVGADVFLHRCSWKPVKGLRLENTGHSLLIASSQLGYVETIGKDGFPNFYQATQVQVHMPSEHLIDGKQFAAEVVVVHKKQAAVNELEGDDLLMTSFLFELGEESSLLKQLHLPQLPKDFATGRKEEIHTPVDLMQAFGPALDSSFYRYDGGVTSPPCAEAAKWFVFSKPMTLSQAQWAAFRELYPSPGNNRPVQPTNGRLLAMNSFEGGDPAKYRFFLSREMGRDRREPDARLILIPVVGGALLCITVMSAVFVREDRRRKAESAGGLAETVGRRSHDGL